MYAEKLLVHDGCQWQRAKSLHTGIVHLVRIFVLAFEFEGEVVGQMSALVVAAEQPQRVGIPNLEGPQVQHTLQGRLARQRRHGPASLPRC